jgi:hypothetical protein
MRTENNDTKMNYDESEAAEFLRRSKRTLQHWRRVGEGPRYVKAGRRVLYRHQDLDEFLSARLRQSTRDVGQSGDSK